MAFEEFTGELDQPTSFAEFDGELDDDLGEKSKGILEAGMSMVAPLPSQIAGGLLGLGTVMSGQGLDKANEVLNSTMKSNFGFGEYKPSTETGQRYSENLGSALNKPIEWAGNAGEFVGGNTGRLAGELTAGTVMALVDPLVVGGALKGTGALAKGRGKTPAKTGPDLESLTKEIESKKAPTEFTEIQGELFLDTPEGKASPYDAGQAGVTEPITPKRQARQMELQLENPETVNIDTAGVPLRPEVWDTVEAVKNNELARMDKEFFDAGGKEPPPRGPGGKFVPKSQRGAVNLDVFKDGYKKEKELPSGVILKASSDGYTFNIVAEKDGVPIGDVSFDKKTPPGMDRLAKETPENLEAFFTNVSPEMKGQGIATDMYKFASELGNDIQPSSVKTPDGKAMWNSFIEKGIAPDGYIPKKQRGAIKIDWRDEKPLGQFKKIPGMDKRLKNLLPDQRPVEQFIKDEANTPDVQQNVAQRASNFLTKGGVYQTMKTDNPLVKRVVDRFLEADNTAKAATQELVHDWMEPLARKLNNKEKADVWAAVKIAEANKTPLTPEMMQKYGFNEKQVEWAQAHQDVMGKMFEKLKESMEAAGIEPVSPQVAYVASRARGDFRRLVYNKEGEIIGIFGSNTRHGLNKDVAKFQKQDPNAKIGEERYFGGQGKNGTAEGFSQMLEFLSKNDPAIKDFVQKVNEQAQKDAFDYMNAKTHTMKKKGIWGMEGNHPFLDQVENAKEGMRAQVRYAETMIKWSEISKAVKETKELMAPENGLNMPNAKSYLNNYIDTALARNPTEIGRAVDSLSAAFGKATGIGTTIPTKALAGARQVTNGLLLGLNIPFLVTNMLQPFKVMPEMSAWLKSMGLEKTFDVGTGYSYLARAGMDIMNERMGAKQPAIIREALDYAQKHHVYSSDLFETGGDVTNSPRLIANKVTQAGAAQIEHVTRKAMFLSYVRMLNENGIKPADGLFEASRKVTDMAMNNYSHQEAPMAYNAVGGLGKAAYNLMSYKHNELSRFAMFAREWANAPMSPKAAKPLLTNLAAQVAFAGIKGTILYAEANEIIKYISKQLGKPTSLTKMLLDSDMSKYAKFGMFNGVGLDMTNRLGMQVAPDSVADAIMPGGGKLVDIAKGVGETIKNPSEYNAKKLATTSMPSMVAGPLDRMWFSPKNAKGEELSFNKNKAQATAVRNRTDEVYKTLGATGLNESTQKMRSYENMQIEKAYQDKRMDVLDNMGKAFYTSKKIPAALIEKYIKYEGDPTTLPKELERMAQEQSIDQPTLQLMKAAASNSLSSAYKLQRRQAK